MCGICGRIFADKNDDRTPRASIEHMMRLMEHRGPDHGGLWGDSLAALGYRRLSVIDIPSGNQPVWSSDGRKILVFNGEIYNFLDLKRQFAAELRFQTESDTEVVMRLYEKFGTGCLQHLRGMFAFAIWDQEEEALFFARDRAGKKPFFYSLQNGNFIFASELRALLVHEDFNFEINQDSIHHFLSLQYIPSPQTIFKNVFKLPAGHYGVLKSGDLNIHRYWKLDYTPQPWLEAEALDKFQQLLREAVSLRLISDVPLGAFLSGGIDSTAIVSMMAGIAPGRVRTFNISFREEEFNESPFAKAVSGQFATEHQQLTVVPDHAGIIPKLVWHYSEPYADPSAIPSYYLSRLSREFVTVALSGDGGDELFGGYPRYLFDHTGAREGSTNSMFVRAAQRIPMNMRGFWRIRKWFEEKFLNIPEIYFQKISFFDETEKKQLYSAAFLEATQNVSTLQWLSKRMHPFQKLEFPQNLMAFDTHTYLPDDLLVKQDIASMACSLEVRAPLLDQQIMEFAASLPVSLKIRNGTTKYLLRAYLRGKVPESLIQRPKMGFGVPLKSWFRNELRSMTEDVLLSQAATQRGYFRKGVIEKLLNRHGSGLFDHSYQLYALLVLEIWHLLFIDNRKESLAQGRFTV